MKKKLILMLALVAMVCLFTLSVSATPQKPDLGVSFGEVQEIPGFTPPSQKFVNTDERVLLYDGKAYATYPTYYITKDSTTFEMTFDAINATGKSYDATSVVMVEAPTGITHFKGGTFSGYTNILYCKVPATVLTYGNSNGWGAAFENCSTIRMVEFVDGTTPLDGKMFGSNMFSNCTALEYVKLPNNLKTTGGSIFSNCKSLKTVIFGTGFETLPSSGGNFSGSDNKDITSHKELYISATFGGDGIALNDKMFVWTSKETSDDAPKMIFYYTGTKAQAEALQAKALLTDNNGKLAYATIVSIDDFVRADADAKKNYIVYGYNFCDAFYEGEHSENDNPCVINCDRCDDYDGQMKKNPQHNYVDSISYANYLANGTKTQTCQNKDCEHKTTPVVTDVAPIISNFKGYSIKEDGNGLTFGYTINYVALEEYVKVSGKNVELGFVVAAKSLLDGKTPLDKNGEAAGEKVIKATVVTWTTDDKANASIAKYTGADFKITGDWSNNMDSEIYMAGYIIDGTGYAYLNCSGSSNTADYTTYNTVLNSENEPSVSEVV